MDCCHRCQRMRRWQKGRTYASSDVERVVQMVRFDGETDQVLAEQFRPLKKALPFCFDDVVAIGGDRECHRKFVRVGELVALIIENYRAHQTRDQEITDRSIPVLSFARSTSASHSASQLARTSARAGS